MRPGAHRLARPFIGVGVLGGWTTFSTLAVETVALVSHGSAGLALGYLTMSFTVGILAVLGGTALGERLLAAVEETTEQERQLAEHEAHLAEHEPQLAEPEEVG
jgi:hypothetical protein